MHHILRSMRVAKRSTIPRLTALQTRTDLPITCMNSILIHKRAAASFVAVWILAAFVATNLYAPQAQAQDPLTPPGAPTNILVTPGINQLAVGWGPPTPGTNNAPTNYVVQWKSGTQNYSSARQASTSTTTEYTIPNLIGGRQYQIRVRAENSAGGTWSGNVNVTPLTGPAVTDVDVTSVTDSTADITVTLTNPESTSQTVNLRYRTPRGTGAWATETPLSTSSTTRDFTLGSLTTNSDYEVQASLDSNFQTGVRSTTFSTQGRPSNPILRVSPANGQLRASWTVELNGGTVSSQTLEWKESSASSFENATPANDARSYTISSLTNGTEYTVKITVTTNYGSRSSEEVSRTPASSPSVDDITFSNIRRTSTTATVSVINTELANGTIIAYLRHRVKGTTEWSTTATRSVYRTTATFSLTGLAGNTMYEVEAALASDFQNSVVKDLQTAKSPPGPPEAIGVTHGDAELNLSWSAPSNNGGGEITGYVIQWRAGDQSYSTTRQLQVEADITSTPITSLINGTEYTVRVYATNSIGNGPPAEATGTPSTIPGSPPLNLTASACDQVLHLSWMPPKDTGGSPILAYVIQWKSGTEDYDATVRQSIQETADPFFSLENLVNGTEYTMRVAAANMNSYDDMDVLMANSLLWSGELKSTPKAGPCLIELRFGNPLATSVPAYVTVTDAPSGTNVYLRYRPAGTTSWIQLLTRATQADNDTITIELTALTPSTMYEVEASLDSGFSPNGLTIRAFFTTAEGSTIDGPTEGLIAKILRIEPEISTVTVSPDSQVVLSVDVYGRQDILDNGLADLAPSDGRPTFQWDVEGRGSFEEADFRDEWQNALPDDRRVVFNAPDSPGRYQIKVTLPTTSGCLAQQVDETAEEAEARCTANFVVRVKGESVFEDETVPPVNPDGPIPEVIIDRGGDPYDVFTPEDGGISSNSRASVFVGPGAVPNGEYVGIRIIPMGPVSNDGKTWQRYTLKGIKYDVIVVDSSGERIPSYRFEEPATVCIPLPDELLSSLSSVSLLVIDYAGELTLLSTDVGNRRDGIVVCGGISDFPTTVAVGIKGSPPMKVQVEEEEILPDTGGTAPTQMMLLMLMMMGVAVMVAGLMVGGRSGIPRSLRSRPFRRAKGAGAP